MIIINQHIAIDESEIQEEFIRGSGPGGQNVNKVATAVQLRFNVNNSPSLSEDVRRRLFKLARNRITDNGVLVIEAKRFRTQTANRTDAVNRLVELIRKAARKPQVRRRTKPTLASRERRLQTKKIRSGVKRSRSKVHEDD